jgi:light-regulated signal transduction histidine kinase (bacteriophytochrome)
VKQAGHRQEAIEEGAVDSTTSRRQAAPALPAQPPLLFEELLSLAQRLEVSNRELEQFATVASHDLQAPLHKIQALGSLLMTCYGNLIDERGRHYLESIEDAAQRMQALIDNLLTLARITSSTRPFTAVDLEETANDVVSDLEVPIEKSGARVEIDHLPTVSGDRQQLRQMLQNLIANALKFARRDQNVQPFVKVYGQSANGASSIFVEDNGIGFESEQAERVFQIFERLHGPGEYEGTGMGLAISRRIARRHGGDVRAESTPGQGSKFIVILPR